jgi:hypothetical protein
MSTEPGGAPRVAFIIALIAAVTSAAVGALYSAMGLWMSSASRSSGDDVLIWAFRLGIVLAAPMPLAAILLARRIPWLSIGIAILAVLLAALFAAAVPAVMFGLSGA